PLRRADVAKEFKLRCCRGGDIRARDWCDLCGFQSCSGRALDAAAVFQTGTNRPYQFDQKDGRTLFQRMCRDAMAGVADRSEIVHRDGGLRLDIEPGLQLCIPTVSSNSFIWMPPTTAQGCRKS